MLSTNVRLARQFSAGSKQYDLAVIGGGPGGYVAAIKAAQKGLKTVCIEMRGTLGGTCLNVGCIPAKALLNSTHKYEMAEKHFNGHGVFFDGLRYDWSKMQAQKNKAVVGLTGGIEFLFKKNKIDYIKGKGKFASANDIEIDLIDGGKDALSAKHVIIATGSEPAPLPGNVIPLDEKQVVSSTGSLVLEKPPKKMIVVGAGVIGLEMGSVYNRLGTEVTAVQHSDRICPFLDIEVSKAYQKILQKQGIKFLLNHSVVGGKAHANGVTVDIETKGERKSHETDVVLVSTGRRPYTGGL